MSLPIRISPHIFLFVQLGSLLTRAVLCARPEGRRRQTQRGRVPQSNTQQLIGSATQRAVARRENQCNDYAHTFIHTRTGS